MTNRPPIFRKRADRLSRCSRSFRRLLSFLCVIALLSCVLCPRIYAADTPIGPGFILPPSEDTLQNRSILLLGDSFIAGYTEDEEPYLWSTLLDTICGMEVTNCAVTGSTVTRGPKDGYIFMGTYYPYVYRPLPSGDFDLILVEGGMNDWMLGAPLGDVDSTDARTYMGALNLILDRLEETYPDATIVGMTGWEGAGSTNALGLTTDAYHEALLEIFQTRNYPCLDASDTNISGIYAASESFRATYFLSSTDAWHLNEQGHFRFLPVIATWLTGILNDA